MPSFKFGLGVAFGAAIGLAAARMDLISFRKARREQATVDYSKSKVQYVYTGSIISHLCLKRDGGHQGADGKHGSTLSHVTNKLLSIRYSVFIRICSRRRSMLLHLKVLHVGRWWLKVRQAKIVQQARFRNSELCRC
jgi:hypothetical protein